MHIDRINKDTGERETIVNTQAKKSSDTDTKIFADVLLLTMLEIMGVEKFRVALSQALDRLSGDSHLKTERKQAKEFFNVISDLKYLGWQSDDFKM